MPENWRDDPEKAAVMSAMNAAGDAAEAKLRADVLTDPKTAEAVQVIGKWFAQNYMQAGYKRLSRALIAIYKAK
jgi:hypothetical protein